jgi:hypothetical protein
MYRRMVINARRTEEILIRLIKLQIREKLIAQLPKKMLGGGHQQ